MSRAVLLGAVVVALLVAGVTLLVLRLGDGAGDEVTGQTTPAPTASATATGAPTPTPTPTPTSSPTAAETPAPPPTPPPDDQLADPGDALPGDDADPSGAMPDTGGGLALALLLLAAGYAMMRR